MKGEYIEGSIHVAVAYNAESPDILSHSSFISFFCLLPPTTHCEFLFALRFPTNTLFLIIVISFQLQSINQSIFHPSIHSSFFHPLLVHMMNRMLQLVDRSTRIQIARFILWIDRPGFRFLGQACVQFIIAWHRYSLYVSSRLFSLSCVISSRESAIHRYACCRIDGPRYLSPCHQYDGHDVEQQAQRMHSYRPSRSRRSCSPCSPAISSAATA